MKVIVINLTPSDIKRSALVAAGVDPRSHGMRRAGRVHTDRKAALKRGHTKHKGQLDF